MANVPTNADIGRCYAEELDQKEKARAETKIAKMRALKRAHLQNTRKRALEEDIEPVPVLEEYELISSGAEGKVATKADIAKSILSPNCINVCYYIGRKGGRCKNTANLRNCPHVYIIITINGDRIKVKYCVLHWTNVKNDLNGEREEQQEIMNELVELALECARAIAPEPAKWLEPSLALEIAGPRRRTRERPNSPDSEEITASMNRVDLDSVELDSTTTRAQAPSTTSATTTAQATSTIPAPPPQGQAKRHTRASAATTTVETPDRGATLAHKVPAPNSDAMDTS